MDKRPHFTKVSRGRGVYAFVDAANLFYGGERSLHWRLDYEKLIKYLCEKFGVSKVFYYAGVDVDAYKEEGKEIDLAKLVKYYEDEVTSAKGGLSTKKDKTDEEIFLLGKHLERAKFYRDLDKFGYDLRIKATKVFKDAEGVTTTKANCDVDLTFDMMRYMSQYSEALVLSGDGDFAPIIEYLQKKHKKIRLLARSERTAREMRELAGDDFIDFKSIRESVEAVEPRKTKRGWIPDQVGNDKKMKKDKGPASPPAESAGTAPAGRREDGQNGRSKRKVPVFRRGF